MKVRTYLLSSILPLGLLAAGLFGCQDDTYEPERKFVDLYVDLKLATVAYTGEHDEANRVRRVILAQHEIEADEFDRFFNRLMEHPESWSRFQASVLKRMEEAKIQKD